ncbi:MAG: PHB depolymerase family esterase [Acidimicrobiales bacterium]
MAPRTYRLEIPTAYDPDEPTPLIFNFHGLGSNAVAQSVYSSLPKLAQGMGIIVVSPDALSGRWRMQAADGAPAPDIVLVRELLADINARYCVDQDRIFAAGMSLGGLMSAEVACGIPDTFAAIGMVTLELKPARCEPVPALVFHGTADNTVRYGALDSDAEDGTLKNLKDWATLDGCEVEPELEKLGPDVEHRVYPGCEGGAEVELYTVIGGGHTWPGSAIKIGPTTDTVDATELILEFFAKHPKSDA